LKGDLINGHVQIMILNSGRVLKVVFVVEAAAKFWVVSFWTCWLMGS
jgi:hypothetical protein